MGTLTQWGASLKRNVLSGPHLGRIFNMLLRENFYFAILCVTTVVSGCVAFMAWIRREEAPATRPFTWLMVAIAAYAGAGAMGTASVSTSNTILWAQMEAVLSSTVTALFFTFTLHFTHRRQWLTFWRRCAIWAIPVFNMLLVMTNGWHYKVWTHFAAIEGTHFLKFHNGPGYFWLAVWFYIYVITGSLLVARTALTLEKIYRQQAITVIASAVPPVVVGTLYVFDAVPPGLSLLPMSFLFTGIVYFTSLFRFRLFDLLPIARDTLIENMSDCVLVLDNRDRVIDMNPAAWQFTHRLSTTMGVGLLGGLKQTQMLGQPVRRVLEEWPTLVRHCQRQENTEVLISLCQQPPLHVDLRLTLLSDKLHRPTGKLLVIRDITDIYQTQIALKQTNEIQQKTQEELQRTNDLLDRRLRKIETLQDQLKEQAIRDGLTKLFNRRYFEEALSAEFAKAKRAGTPLSVILIDIDNFKRVNDTYGHQAGDCALQVFSDVIHRHIRNSDIACRYGGEEFIIAMPGMTMADAYQRAEALRIALRETEIQYKGEVIQATLSGGVGSLPEWGGGQDGLITMVDKALYRAKEEGRDRICGIQLNNLPIHSYTKETEAQLSNS
ncbi:MAG: diguanylate cyclase [Cyanobacteria bacterium J06632_3]